MLFFFWGGGGGELVLLYTSMFPNQTLWFVNNPLVWLTSYLCVSYGIVLMFPKKYNSSLLFEEGDQSCYKNYMKIAY
jgi:hypothetical protein